MPAPSQKGRVQKMGVPPGFELEVSRTTMYCPSMAHHLGVTAWGAISFPFETPFYDVIGLDRCWHIFFTSPCWILLDCSC